jgi:hypothetical protein
MKADVAMAMPTAKGESGPVRAAGAWGVCEISRATGTIPHFDVRSPETDGRSLRPDRRVGNQAPTGRQHPGRLLQDCFVLFLCVEESERVHHDDGAGAFGANWQPPQVTTHPVGGRAKFARNLSRAVQKGRREVEADDVESTLFRQGDRVSPMATTDVDDAGCR